MFSYFYGQSVVSVRCRRRHVSHIRLHSQAGRAEAGGHPEITGLGMFWANIYCIEPCRTIYSTGKFGTCLDLFGKKLLHLCEATAMLGFDTVPAQGNLRVNP